MSELAKYLVTDCNYPNAKTSVISRRKSSEREPASPGAFEIRLIFADTRECSFPPINPAKIQPPGMPTTPQTLSYILLPGPAVELDSGPHRYFWYPVTCFATQ